MLHETLDGMPPWSPLLGGDHNCILHPEHLAPQSLPKQRNLDSFWHLSEAEHSNGLPSILEGDGAVPHVWSHSAFQTAEQDPRFCAGGCSASHGTGQQLGTSLCCRHHALSLASPASQQPQLPFCVRDLLQLWIKCVFSSGIGVRMHCEVLLSLKEEAFKKLRYLGHREEQNKTKQMNKQK